MSLPAELWDALRLDSDVVRARAAYFASYAQSEAPMFEVDGFIQALRDGPIASGEQAVVSLFDQEESGPIVEFRQRIADVGEGRHYPQWVRVAERADALRQAAIAELLYDTRSGIDTLMRSAGEYRRLGLPFGTFLETAATGTTENTFEAVHNLDLILNAESQPVPAGDGIIPLNRVLGAPAQQVAVLLTAMSRAESVYEIPRDAVASAVQAGGSAPVGTTAQPIALWWECGRHLIDLASGWQVVNEVPGRPEARERLRQLITEVAAAHGTALRNAQYDGFHWPVAAARIDLIDLDLAGLVAISGRLFRQLKEPYWDMMNDFDNLSMLSKVSIQVGLDLAGW